MKTIKNLFLLLFIIVGMCVFCYSMPEWLFRAVALSILVIIVFAIGGLITDKKER